MKTVLMAIPIILMDNKTLLRKFDPSRNPYKQAWGGVSGKLVGEGSIEDMMNRELKERWNITAKIDKQLSWDEDIKKDHDGEVKRFIYLDALCSLASGDPRPVNHNEELRWVALEDLPKYDLCPPGVTSFKKLGYLK
jgi:ADP-ribose pyrophosphatase YjhB (NUDIX family)